MTRVRAFLKLGRRTRKCTESSVSPRRALGALRASLLDNQVSGKPFSYEPNMLKLTRTQRILIISLLTIPELVALVPLAWHYLRPSPSARNANPPSASTQASPGHLGQ